MRIIKNFDIISFFLMSLFVSTVVTLYISIGDIRENKILLFSFSASILFLIAALLFIRIFLLKKLIRPLEEIDRVGSLIAHGNFTTRIKTKSCEELEDITNNFNSLAVLLGDTINRLEKSTTKEQQAIRELAILSEMIGAVTSELKLESMLEIFLERTMTLLKAEHSGIFLFEGNSEEPTMFKSTFTHEVSLDCAKTMVSKPTFEKVLETYMPLRINTPIEIISQNHPEIKNLIISPLTSTGNKLSGLLLIINKEGGFNEEDEDMLFNFSFLAFQTLAVHNEIANLATTDGLTGLNNYRTFHKKLDEEIERARRYLHNLSLLLIDIDNFKLFNDIYGHQTGDKALKAIAELIEKNIRSIDLAARYGGEEFIVILPETAPDQAQVVAERLRKAISEYVFEHKEGEQIKITASIGHACFPHDAHTKETLINRADQALYFAKESGKNKAFSYQDTLIGIIERKPDELDKILSDPSLKGIIELAKAIDAKSYYTRGHSVEVAAYAIIMGKRLGLDKDELESLKIASILHDIGNINVPEYILNKPGALTPEEKSIIRGHPGLAEMILRKYPYAEEVLSAILYHHERFDGCGYPRGMKGEEIPLLSRILAVAEAYQAMISSRPYREKKEEKESLNELEREAGHQFDPRIVNEFIKSLEELKDTNQKQDDLTTQ